MTERVASLPMYDADRPSVEAWWRGVARALRAEGLADVPASLTWPTDLDAHWHDPRLLLSQSCGYPLVTTLKHAVQVVGAFRYTAPGCAGIGYRSELVARDDDATSIEDFRGRIAAVNALDSQSGFHALRRLVAPLAVDGRFFSEVVVSGSHRASLAAVRSGSADLAAIDCVTLAGLLGQAPSTLDGLRCIGATAPAPGLPLVTSLRTTAEELRALRRSLEAACDDDALTGVRQALFIEGFEIVAACAWQVVDDARRCAGHGSTSPVF